MAPLEDEVCGGSRDGGPHEDVEAQDSEPHAREIKGSEDELYQAEENEKEESESDDGGGVGEVRRLASAGIDLDVAAIDSKPKVALELLRLGADATTCASAVVSAAAQGYEDLLGELLRCGGNPGQKMFGVTAMRWAVQNCREECALMLFEAGAWEAEDEDGDLAEDHDALLRCALSRGLRRLVARIAEAHPDFVRGYDLRSTGEMWRDRWHALRDLVPCLSAKRRRPTPLDPRAAALLSPSAE